MALQRTNIAADDLVMDTRAGKDSRYYCLPPFRGNPDREPGAGSVKTFYLVSQGRNETKASVSGFPDNGYRRYTSVKECVDAWQALCKWGVHPHPVDPNVAGTHTSPSSSSQNSPRKHAGARSPGAQLFPSIEVKREGGAAPVSKRERSAAPVPVSTAELIRLCTPAPARSAAPSPKESAPRSGEEEGFLRFAIRGGGIVSSSAGRTEERFTEMQSRGEEPELLVTRSLREASFFAAG
ncbi:hypothetical protein B0H14DRAFT_3490390 [Mycena olivaceomarginata]|nr:hypothetical protein B0H14DRAFT_3490390 [Mycena olivaceomarginata]